MHMLFSSLASVLLISAAESKQYLHGQHGSLHPNETDGNCNRHKLEIFFDTDCVSTQEEAEVSWTTPLYTCILYISLAAYSVLGWPNSCLAKIIKHKTHNSKLKTYVTVSVIVCICNVQYRQHIMD